jgi:hypothetical protein
VGNYRSRSHASHGAIAIGVLDQFRSASVDRLRNLILLAYQWINNPHFPSYNSEEAFNDGVLLRIY